MDVILQTYYILLPIVATALVGWVGVLLKEQHKKEQDKEQYIYEKEQEQERVRKANSEGIMLVLRYMLNRYHVEYMIQDKMTYDQYKDWMDLYKAYKALGGNSIAEDWNRHIENLEKTDFISDMPPFEAMIRENIKKQTKRD